MLRWQRLGLLNPKRSIRILSRAPLHKQANWRGVKFRRPIETQSRLWYQNVPSTFGARVIYQGSRIFETACQFVGREEKDDREICTEQLKHSGKGLGCFPTLFVWWSWKRNDGIAHNFLDSPFALVKKFCSMVSFIFHWKCHQSSGCLFHKVCEVASGSLSSFYKLTEHKLTEQRTVHVVLRFTLGPDLWGCHWLALGNRSSPERIAKLFYRIRKIRRF